MIIDKPGFYRMSKAFKVRGERSISEFPVGSVFQITQIDSRYRKVTGPDFDDWTPWEIPAEPVDRKGAQ